ncbi:protein RETICULATA-RELATED 4 [Citrus sinensis]|uniref:Protein RETICULATA-RELATED 4 n=1 Tax=Citrus sinensis TaxID=2711 RepID=A0ACB8MX18_CITSI|nr:protein RETICULATA-RELATED 4 [Citrus sinensis]KAH9789874.1 protein RETICULATA-RELATED 4 [Citrus sinensis]
MSIASCFFASASLSTISNNNTPELNLNRPSPLPLRLSVTSPPSSSSFTTPLSLHLHHHRRPPTSLFLAFSTPTSSGGGGGDDNYNNNGGSGGGGGGNNNDGDGDGENAGEKNREEALIVLAEDLAAAIKDGRIPGAVLSRYFELEKSGLFKWLMQFGGFKERLLADDLFLAKVLFECGVGIFTKTAAEYDRRRENFFKELEIVFADVVMAIIADFMLVYLPAPTVALRSSFAVHAGPISKFFYNCPDNAFQVALSGTSYSLLQRLGAIARNGAKLFAVGTTSSLVGTAVTNALINARKAVDKSSEGEVENVPILSTSVAYGVYMAVSSNLRYQVLAGVIEQRILEPLLHQHKLILSAICFAVRTGNTYLGSLLWVDYARLIGIQKAHEDEKVLSG